METVSKLDAVYKHDYGDGNRLVVILGKYKNRYTVQSFAEGELITSDFFNKRKNAEVKYNKILDEF